MPRSFAECITTNYIWPAYLSFEGVAGPLVIRASALQSDATLIYTVPHMRKK